MRIEQQVLTAQNERIRMSEEKRSYQVEYKVTFKGTTSEYSVDKSDQPVDITADRPKLWGEIHQEIQKMDKDEWSLDFSCGRCGEYVAVTQEGMATFECDCTTETPDKY